MALNDGASTVEALDKALTCEPAKASVPPATSSSKHALWKRALWMQLGAVNGLIALLLLLATDASLLTAGHAASIRLGAQVHFMHSMATLSCATFMNIGASGARLAPAFFLSGILLFCLPIYAQAVGAPSWVVMIKPVGLAAFVTAWLILAWSAREIDRG